MGRPQRRLTARTPVPPGTQTMPQEMEPGQRNEQWARRWGRAWAALAVQAYPAASLAKVSHRSRPACALPAPHQIEQSPRVPPVGLSRLTEHASFRTPAIWQPAAEARLHLEPDFRFLP